MARSRNRKPPAEDAEREERIAMEIVVDAYGPEEQAMGWYYYLENKLAFPFDATCDCLRDLSPLNPGDHVEVVGMGAEEDCRHEMFVKIRYGVGKRDTLAVPLMQLAPDDDPNDESEDDTLEAVEDWRYWTARGYTL